MAWTSPKTWTADELLTASDLNEYVSDNLSALYALTQGGGRKNLLRNGQMQVHQRTAVIGAPDPGTFGTSITTGGFYSADCWRTDVTTLGTWTQSIENDAPTGSGFRKSLKMLCSSADASPATTDTVKVYMGIEGQNVQSVLKGTTSAQQLTLSFWVKSNKTGTYICELHDNDNNRHCSKSYTIVASATWEEQSITFPADLTGAFDNDNAGSLYLYFHLAEGPSQTSGTLATTWASYTAANRAVGQTNLGASNSNYWQVTGVQLEVGSAATGFEFKNFDQELAECQRYYQKTYAYGTAPGTNSVIGIRTATCDSVQSATRHFINGGAFPTRMRSTPTVTVYSEDGTQDRISAYNDSATKLTFSSLSGTGDTSVGTYIATTATGTGNMNYVFHYVAVSDVA